MHTASCALNLLQREKNREEIREGEVGGEGGEGVKETIGPGRITSSGLGTRQPRS